MGLPCNLWVEIALHSGKREVFFTYYNQEVSYSQKTESEYIGNMFGQNHYSTPIIEMER